MFNRLSIKGTLALVGVGLLGGPVAIAPLLAQTRSSADPYCFVVKDALSVFAQPRANAATADKFNQGDIAYATANPPRTRFDGGRAFVEVAIYNSQKAWVPRQSTIDGVPLLVDLTTDQCTSPVPGAVGFNQGAVGGPSGPSSAPKSDNSTPYCFAVQDTLSVFAQPRANAAMADKFNQSDIAYATANPPNTRFDGNRAFVEVAIYNSQKAWVPRQSTIDGVPLLVDLTTDQCTRPPQGAAGYDSSF